MINIRFHLVSLVAVFLALGVGVAMGASFIDRATVESMQGRVDDLEVGFRERGDDLDVRQAQSEQDDVAASALTEDASRAVDGVLEGEAVVVIAPNELPDGSVELLTSAVQAAGADLAATLRLQDGVAGGGDDEPSESDLDALARAVGDSSGDEDPVVAARDALAEALAILSVSPEATGSGATGADGQAGPDTNGSTDGTGSTTDGTGSSTDGTDGAGGATAGGEGITSPADATGLLQRFTEEGLISIDTGGRPAEEAFPATSGVRYLVLAPSQGRPSASEWTVPMAVTYGDLAPATMVVAAFDEPRPVGALPAGESGVAQLLDPLRSGPASTEVTTVAEATEPLARLSVVYSLAALGEGIVGHYGLGDGVSAPFPPAAEE